jgi:hypothetical protein
MRRQFDAVNAEAKLRRETRYKSQGAKLIEEDQRSLRTTPEVVDLTPEMGENDSSGA